jgi:H+/Cl- antiporter ClcA
MAGAEGGLLTPGMAIGALLAICFASIWNLAFPAVPLGAFALIGAAAFLAASMQLPLTAIALIFEFTHLGQDFLIPFSFSVAGSVAALHTITHLREKSGPMFKRSAGGRQNPALGSL